jgi:hypothetical protein
VFLRVARAPPEETDAGCRPGVHDARNLALNHLRDTHRPNMVELTDAAGPASQELAAAVQQALDALPGLERDVFLRETAGSATARLPRRCG